MSAYEPTLMPDGVLIYHPFTQLCGALLFQSEWNAQSLNSESASVQTYDDLLAGNATREQRKQFTNVRVSSM